MAGISGKVILQITKKRSGRPRRGLMVVTLKIDKYVEPDCESAVALANATEAAARSSVLQVSSGAQSWVRGMASTG